MLVEVGDLAQGVGGAKAGGDGEKVGPWWGSVEGLEGVAMVVGIDGVMLMLGVLSISLIFSVLGFTQKGFACEGGLMLTRQPTLLACVH